jgi:hypothetical protein
MAKDQMHEEEYHWNQRESNYNERKKEYFEKSNVKILHVEFRLLFQ